MSDIAEHVKTIIAKRLGVAPDNVTETAASMCDIERRLGNLAKARRCGAKTRAGGTCKQAAVRGRFRCRIHGGARGSGRPPR